MTTLPRISPTPSAKPSPPARAPGYVHVLENISCQPGTVHTVFDTSAPERRDVGAMAAALPAEAAQGQLRGGRQ